MLEQFRKHIDDLDERILTLLNERAQWVLEISEEKHRRGRPVVDADREAQVVARLAARNQGPMPDESVIHIYRAIMAEMRQLQEAHRG